MGTLTLTQMQSEVQASHSSRTDFDEVRRLVALNISQTRIARLFDWNELQALDTGTIGDASDPAIDKYEAIPTNIRKIYSFKISDPTSRINSRKLGFVQQRLWDMELPETEAWDTYIPTKYTIWNKQFEFFKIPDKSYTYEIRSSKWPTDLNIATPSQTSDLDHKDDMIIALAVSWGFLTFREMEEANRWFAVFKNMFSSATNQDMTEYETDIKPGIEHFFNAEISGSPWADPFKRTGVE